MPRLLYPVLITFFFTRFAFGSECENFLDGSWKLVRWKMSAIWAQENDPAKARRVPTQANIGLYHLKLREELGELYNAGVALAVLKDQSRAIEEIGDLLDTLDSLQLWTAVPDTGEAIPPRGSYLNSAFVRLAIVFAELKSSPSNANFREARRCLVEIAQMWALDPKAIDEARSAKAMKKGDMISDEATQSYVSRSW